MFFFPVSIIFKMFFSLWFINVEKNNHSWQNNFHCTITGYRAAIISSIYHLVTISSFSQHQIVTILSKNGLLYSFNVQSNDLIIGWLKNKRKHNQLSFCPNELCNVWTKTTTKKLYFVYKQTKPVKCYACYININIFFRMLQMSKMSMWLLNLQPRAISYVKKQTNRKIYH